MVTSGAPGGEGSGDHPQPKTRRIGWLGVLAGALAAIVGGVIGGFIVRGTSGGSSTPTATGTQSVCQATTVADKGLPSVVTISAQAPGGQGGGTGTGEIIRAGGYILTNNHVISVAANGGTVEVLYNDGRSVKATIVGRDPLTDLAVLKADDGAKGLPVIAVGSSKSLVVGQPVVALGAPLGLFGTVTAGIVSATDRDVEVPGDAGQSAHLVGAIQTDASINPGNSGGPLVNCAAALVGVNTAIATVPNEAGQGGGGSVGLGFSIASDVAVPIADELIDRGTVSHFSVGMQVQTLPPEVARRAGLPAGLFVESVTSGGPAAQAGITQGDVVTKIGDEPAVSPEQLTVAELGARSGQTVDLTVEKGGTSAQTTLTPVRQGQ
ncbi:MAG TPA: trypsin-like peptidase domain-containing protein [Pseudonocardiaceae bacterium]|nr:trypsin-like peptidase domain-containing protein [Pseudonocardiaceae bacterium]